MLAIGSLDVAIRALVLVAFGVVLITALLLASSGLGLPRVELLPHIKISVLFFGAVITVLSIGWGYLLAAVLACSNRIRWPALGLLTVALLSPVVTTLGRAQTQGIELDVLPVLLFAAPELALLLPVWATALIRAATNRHGITPFTVLGMIGSVLLFFGTYLVALRLTGAASQGSPVIEFMIMSLTFLLPLYLVAGIDLTELLFLTGAGAWTWTRARLGSRAGRLLPLLAGTAALATEAGLDRNVFARLGNLAYAAGCIVIVVLLLRRILPAARIQEAPSFSLLFVIVAVAWFTGTGFLSVPGLPGSPPTALTVTGAGCLLVAAGLSFRRHSNRNVLLLGLMGLWLLYLNLPVGHFGIQISSQVGFLDAVVVDSGVAVILLGIAAERYPGLVLWRAATTVWTLSITVIGAYVLVITRANSLQELLPIVLVTVLLVALSLVMHSIPLILRVIGLGLVIVGLFGSAMFTLFGGPHRQVAVASATVLAVAVVWEVLMSGRRITNRTGNHWPREARVVGFLGYALVGLAVALFVATVEGLNDVILNPASFPVVGLLYFGVPTVVYALRAAWIPERGSIELKAQF